MKEKISLKFNSQEKQNMPIADDIRCKQHEATSKHDNKYNKYT